jgi:16S rRNA G966 N2-methylase RsmD
MEKAKIFPIESSIPADRQSAKRHYGVHPYFTRRPYNVVRKYILHYSSENERVLDPFGGSGVAAIEAFLENRHGIHNDINPLANFIAQGIVDLAKGDISIYKEALATVKERCEATLSQLYEMSERQIKELTQSVRLPENVKLPSNSDVEHYHELFTPRQLVALALLKTAIEEITDKYARKGMTIAWSATLTKLNKTFLSAEGRAESRGGSSIFSIYRYKVAKEPVELQPWPTFYERALNVLAAKSEIDKCIEAKKQTVGWRGKFEVRSKDIEELADDLQGSVDYIFTDPPYGGHISYLDLSTLWNSWLGQMPTMKARKNELIVGGELDHGESLYTDRLGKSVRACVKMLKTGRWLSLVFQHWNIAYFEAILCSAADSGADLKAAVSQVGDPIWSMHKKKSNQSVLAGEMILTFQNVGKPKKVRIDKSFDVSKTIGEILAADTTGKMYGEYLFNKVVMEAWNSSAIGSLAVTKDDFIEMVREHGWHYDEENYYWVNGKNGYGGLSLFSNIS